MIVRRNARKMVKKMEITKDDIEMLKRDHKTIFGKNINQKELVKIINVFEGTNLYWIDANGENPVIKKVNSPENKNYLYSKNINMGDKNEI